MMKKIFNCIFAIALAAAAVSCAKEIASPEDISGDRAYVRVPMSFTAGLEVTKTTFDGTKIAFESGDKMALFDGTQKNEFSISSMAEDGSSAVFSGEAAEVDSYVAVLPSDAMTAVAPADNHISVKISSTQTVDADHCVDPAALIATSLITEDTEISFTNQFSLVKVTISEDNIESVMIKGNNNEVVGGTQWISTEDGSVINHAEGYTEKIVFVDGSGNPAAFIPGDYYIAVWPVEFTKGFTLVLTDTDGGKAFKETSKAVSFARNGGKNLDVIDTGLDFVPRVIMNEAQLRAWAEYSDYWVNGDEFELGADIALTEAWETVPTFLGSLDGKGHSITNLVVSNAATRTGFIGTLGQNGALKNITFGAASGDSSSITLCQSDDGNWCYAGIVGYVHEGSSLTDLVSYVPVIVSAECTGKHSAGGFAGNMKKNTSITGCVNWAAVTDNSSYASTSADSCIGGIVGMSDSAGSIVKDCINEGAPDGGEITNNCTGNPNIGGIVGRLSGSGTVENCRNNAFVVNNVGSAYSNDNFKVFVGGIVGAVTGGNAQIIKCYNNQKELAQASLSTRLGMGGIVGGATASGLQILGCISNTGAMAVNFENSKDIAVGGIIGYSSQTIRISKSEDGIWTENRSGYKQAKNHKSTAYIGGIAGLLDKASTDNIVEYCKTSASARFEFNDKQTTSGKAANVGGICGASKGVITNCTNNMHIYCRKSSNGYPKINFGGICGGYSESRYPQEISYCTNNGNVGAYAATKGDPTFGGIICALYPGKTVVKFCTNRGALTTGQAKTDGTICSIQNHGGFSMGALSGEVGNTSEGSSPITIFEGCVVDSRAIAYQVSNYDFMGLVCGWLAGTKDETGHPVVNFGSVENPVMITTTSAVKTGTNADPTVETAIATATDYDSIKAYLFAPYLFYRPDKASNFPDGIDSDAFKARYKLNIVVGDAAPLSTERFN